MIDPQRLRDLADSLDECEWNHSLGSAALCRAAADELERLRFGLRVALCRVFHYAPRDVTDEFMTDWLNLMAAKAAGGGSNG